MYGSYPGLQAPGGQPPAPPHPPNPLAPLNPPLPIPQGQGWGILWDWGILCWDWHLQELEFLLWHLLLLQHLQFLLLVCLHLHHSTGIGLPTVPAAAPASAASGGLGGFANRFFGSGNTPRVMVMQVLVLHLHLHL